MSVCCVADQMLTVLSDLHAFSCVIAQSSGVDTAIISHLQIRKLKFRELNNLLKATQVLRFQLDSKGC